MSDAVGSSGSAHENGKVNLLIVASSLWIGGAEMVMRHLAETIDRSRFRVSVYCVKERGQIGDEMARAGIEMLGATGSGKPEVSYLSFTRLLKVIRERRIDVIHTHTVDGLVDGAFCRLLMPRLRLVHTFHFGNYPHMYRHFLWMERIFSRCADRLLSVGEVQQRQIRRALRLSGAAMRTIYNGVPLGALPADTSFKSSIGAEGRVLVGTIATLIPQKGLFDLLNVARRVVDAGHEVTFAIVGEGRLRPALEARRRELGLDDTVVLTGWVTGASEVALPAFDVFFQPSLWEAMSIVILEAMAAGKAVVATKVGENGHIIEDGVSGLLVDRGDVDGMAAALGRVIADPGVRACLGRAARARVEQRFTVAQMTRAYEQLYLDTLR